jgi:hypothetical protein
MISERFKLPFTSTEMIAGEVADLMLLPCRTMPSAGYNSD